MSGEVDMHTETESEDGGVALSKDGSDDMDIDAESAPTSASESPVQSSGDFMESSILSMPAIVLSGDNETSSEVAELIHPQQPGTPTLPMDLSFAEALSGTLYIVPENFSFPDEEEILDPENPHHQPFGTHQVFPDSLVAAPDAPTVDEDQTSLDVAVHGLSQSIHSQTGESHTVDFSSTQYTEPTLALPSLHDVFGSDFLLQSAPPTEIAFSSHVENYPADFWDDVEDNMKNFRIDEFFNYWKQKYTNRVAGYPRISHLANTLSKVQRPQKITVDDLDQEHRDYQGIHWSRFQTTKVQAREVRRMTYRNHRNIPSENLPFGTRAYRAEFHKNFVPNSDLHFRFREMNLKCRPYTAHFQLRHNLSASSKNAVFYSQRPSDDDDECDTDRCYGPKVMCFNPETDTTECAMDLTKLANRDAARLERVTTLTASDGVLVAGGLEGVYAIKSLSATFENRPITGVVTEDANCSTNHVQTYLDRRSGLPQAVFDSNDMTIRTLDCLTNKFVRHHKFPFQVNCSAMSPDGRLRILAGDTCFPVIANAETGEKLFVLPGHEDYGFACDWAPDGITMATGHQDGLVQIWDARKLTQSLHTLPMEMGGCRAMAFSPSGSGKRVLVLAEPADFVHIVDAQTFQSKQEIEFFGEISGISMPPDGSRLYIANCDPKYGGIMDFGRSTYCAGHGNGNGRRRRWREPDRKQRSLVDKIMREEYGDGLFDEYGESLHEGYAECLLEEHGDSPLDRTKRDMLKRRRERFKVGRGKSFDWLNIDDWEYEQVMPPLRNFQARQNMDLRDVFF